MSWQAVVTSYLLRRFPLLGRLASVFIVESLLIVTFLLIGKSLAHNASAQDLNANLIEATNTVRPMSTPAPQPGLVIQGDVRLNNAAGSGLAGVRIYRSYASYPGSLVATTDQSGHYESEFAYIPGDEMVTVWAQKEGYTFDPQQYYWRHYYGYEVRTLDFYARPNAYLELSLDSAIVTAGTPITLYIEYHNIGVPHTTINVTPTGLVAFEPPLSMPCKYDQHPNGCTAIGFRALASGVVTFTARATGEVYDEACYCWYWSIADTIEPARLIIADTIWRAWLPLVER